MKNIRIYRILSILTRPILVASVSFTSQANGGSLAVLLTIMTVAVSIFPPFHYELYTRKNENCADIQQHLNKYISSVLFGLLIMAISIYCISPLVSQLSKGFAGWVLVVAVVAEKIFDEINRYAIAFSKYEIWEPLIISRLFLPLLVFWLAYSFKIIIHVDALLFIASLPTLFAIILILLRYPSVLVSSTSCLKLDFHHIGLIAKPWISTLSLMLPSMSEKFSILTVGSNSASSFYLSLTSLSIISYYIDATVLTSKKAKILSLEPYDVLTSNLRLAPLFLFAIAIAYAIAIGQYVSQSAHDYSLYSSLIALLFLGLSILCNTLSLVKEELLFWAGNHRFLSLHMLRQSFLVCIVYLLSSKSVSLLAFFLFLSSLFRFYSCPKFSLSQR